MVYPTCHLKNTSDPSDENIQVAKCQTVYFPGINPSECDHELGYNFVGISFSSDGPMIDTPTLLNEEMVLYFFWTPAIQPYDVTYDMNLAPSVIELKEDQESPIIFPANRNKLFVGWTTKRDDETTLQNNGYMLQEDSVFYGLWREPTVPQLLAFDNNGGEGYMMPLAFSLTFEVPECTFTPPDGQIFDYWYDMKYPERSLEPGELYYSRDPEVMLVAHYQTPGMYRVFYHRNRDNTDDEFKSYYYPAGPTYLGRNLWIEEDREFLGWSVDPLESNGVIDGYWNLNNETHWYAIWGN